MGPLILGGGKYVVKAVRVVALAWSDGSRVAGGVPVMVMFTPLMLLMVMAERSRGQMPGYKGDS
eukprot:5942507-Ditylum_brightwellii.AAC.1